jgi:hypothetical protein
MTPEELRLECLKLVLQSATASGIPVETSQLISRARAYADFVMNRGSHGIDGSVNGTETREKALEEGLHRRSPPISDLGSSIAADGLGGAG